LDEFARHLDELKLEPPLGARGVFENLVTDEMGRLRSAAASIQEGQRRGIRQMHAAFPGRSATQILAESPAGLSVELARSGFSLAEDDLTKLSGLARDRVRFDRVAAAVNLSQSKTTIAGRLGIEPTTVNVDLVLAMTNSPAEAKWLSELLTKNSGQDISAEELLTLAGMERRMNQLQAAAGDKPPVMTAGALGMARGTGWLIGLSFLVCTVGVANAMFMSVTERFTEIATMKCLGALDGFLMMLFLFESGMQGLVGALAGVAFGVSLAMLRALASYGTLMSLPGWGLLAGCGVCVVAGLVLAVLGGVGPAWAAARLAPMEAMRIE
jgi:hypothetical protein